MYNHNKAQQSKNRVHISWDILYAALRVDELRLQRIESIAYTNEIQMLCIESSLSISFCYDFIKSLFVWLNRLQVHIPVRFLIINHSKNCQDYTGLFEWRCLVNAATHCYPHSAIYVYIWDRYLKCENATDNDNDKLNTITDTWYKSDIFFKS